MSLNDLETPALLLDRPKMENNVARLRSRLAGLGKSFRLHVKTLKSPEALTAFGFSVKTAPITVSTLKEAEIFAAHGAGDVLYAVCIAPNKIARIAAIRRSGCDLICVADSLPAADALAQAAQSLGEAFPAVIEIDTDGHRAGVPPIADRLLPIANRLHQGGCDLRGVMAHAGSSYDCSSEPELIAKAEQERKGAVQAADILKAAGLPCPVVSVGSTPTAHYASSLSGVTEVRAGVYTSFDLVMAGIGVCGVSDIALSVLATVIGHQPEKGWIIVDTGWMAMSRDRGTAAQTVDQGYGLVCDMRGDPYPDLILVAANQEHGIAALRPGSTGKLPQLPYGTRVRILPNHACATAAQFDRYHVLDAGDEIRAVWSRFGGW